MCILSMSLAAAVTGQEVQTAGFTFGTEASASSRGALGTFAGAILTRIDHDDYRDWGVSGDNPGKRDIRGVVVTVQDEDLATNEAFTIEGYGGLRSPANTPDPADHFLSSGPIAMPPGAGRGAFMMAITFTTPALADAGEDTFLGIAVPANVAWPSDGLALQLWYGVVVTGFTIYDLPGHGMPASPAYATYAHNVPSVSVLPPMQFMVEPLLDETSGTATAVTNQTTFLPSNSAPGTASFFSALHPDAAAPPRNTGRFDDPGFRVHDPDLAGDPVLFFLSNAFGASVYLGPGNEGTFCANPLVLVFAGASVASPRRTPADRGGEAAIVLPLGGAGAPIRGALRGLSVVWWALGIDEGGVLRGSPCARQRF
jgi:hypothetical protein